uniref:Uncharacterized protein n=1 Tax=Rhizophagus irregularis (strain DAOM 181602 / DAOM 197198 / MUCL 43194) TaxID=747089 RepID=U9T0A8_RHIID
MAEPLEKYGLNLIITDSINKTIKARLIFERCVIYVLFSRKIFGLYFERSHYNRSSNTCEVAVEFYLLRVRERNRFMIVTQMMDENSTIPMINPNVTAQILKRYTFQNKNGISKEWLEIYNRKVRQIHNEKINLEVKVRRIFKSSYTNATNCKITKMEFFKNYKFLDPLLGNDK